MTSNQFQTVNQQGFSSGASSSGVQSEDARSAAAGEDPLSKIPENLRFLARLRQEDEKFQQQQQQQPPQEQVRLRIQPTREQTRQTVPQSQRRQAPQRDRNGWLQLLKIIFEDYFLENAALVLLIGIFWFAPTICQYATEWWSSAQTYQDWCKDERVGSFL
jgi:hypothetical protein